LRYPISRQIAVRGAASRSHPPFDCSYLVRWAFNFPFNVFRLFGEFRSLVDSRPQVPQELQSRFHAL
jgi:hypothetical protein